MTLILKLDLDMVKMYLHTKNEVSMSRGSKVIAWTDRQTDTKTDRQTHRQTDRQTWLKTLPTHIHGWWLHVKSWIYSLLSQIDLCIPCLKTSLAQLVYLIQVTKHTSEGFHPRLKPSADITRSHKEGNQFLTKRIGIPQNYKNKNFNFMSCSSLETKTLPS